MIAPLTILELTLEERAYQREQAHRIAELKLLLQAAEGVGHHLGREIHRAIELLSIGYADEAKRVLCAAVHPSRPVTVVDRIDAAVAEAGMVGRL